MMDNPMMRIPFTQYLRPDGRARQRTFDAPDDIGHMAHQLIDLGCRFEAEVLTIGIVSLTCEKGDDLISIQLCDNGPPVVKAVAELVTDAFGKIGE